MLKKGQLHHHFFLLAYPKFAQDQLSNFGAFPLPSSLNSKSCNSRCSWWPVQNPGRKGMESWKQVSATKMNAAWWFQPTPLKNMSSSMGRMTSHIYPIYYGKKTCSKPPTRMDLSFICHDQSESRGFWRWILTVYCNLCHAGILTRSPPGWKKHGRLLFSVFISQVCWTTLMLTGM